MDTKVIPVLRIFDVKKANEFYIKWLGFKTDWKDGGGKTPLYTQISKEHITLHLSEHYGDCTPGSKVFIHYNEIKALHKKLLAKKYKYNKPGLEEAPWNATIMQVSDPFENKLVFNKYHKK